MSMKGFSTTKMLKKVFGGFSCQETVDCGTFVTVQKIGSDKAAQDTLQHSLYEMSAGNVTEVGSGIRVIKLTGHGAKVGDVVRFTSGLLDDTEMGIVGVPNADTLILVGEFSSIPALGVDTFSILRYLTTRVDATGGLIVSASPLIFTRNGADQTVIEDTVTPANNRPLPVKLASVTGDINITANDLNVQTSHIGANADSVRIGDGVEEWAINAALEGTVHDADALAQLVLILAKIIAAPATEAKQDDLIAKFGAIGRQAEGASAAVVLSTEDKASLDAIITATEKFLTPVDFLDTGFLIPTGGNLIPKSSSNAMAIVASLAADVKKIQVIEDIGSFMAIYSDAAKTALLCYLPLAGGEIEISIPSTTAIYIGAVNDIDIDDANTRLMINFLG